MQKTIDSVISHSFRAFEWIVIDGGFTDGSKELIDKYSDHFAYFVSEPNKGIYNTMNKGVSSIKDEASDFSCDCRFEDIEPMCFYILIVI